MRADHAVHAHAGQAATGRLRHAQRAARQLHEVRHHRRGGGHAAGAWADEQRLPYRVAVRHHGVHHARHLGDQQRLRHQRRMHPRLDAAAAQARQTQVLDREAEFPGIADVFDVDARDAFHMHAGGIDCGVERQCGEDGELLRGVDAVDVERRIGLGIAQPLRFGQRVGEAAAFFFHGGEDVVGSAVDDAGQGVHAVGGEAGAQRLDDGNAARHRAFEAERQAPFPGAGEERVAAGGEQRLVGGDDVLAGGNGVLHQRLRRAVAADQLQEHVDVVACQRAQFGVELRAAERDVRLRRAAGHAGQLDWASGAFGDGVSILDQEPGNAGADGAKARQTDSQGSQSFAACRAAARRAVRPFGIRCPAFRPAARRSRGRGAGRRPAAESKACR